MTSGSVCAISAKLVKLLLVIHREVLCKLDFEKIAFQHAVNLQNIIAAFTGGLIILSRRALDKYLGCVMTK